MKYFVALWIALNIAAIVGFLIVCYKANKAHELEVKRGRRPW